MTWNNIWKSKEQKCRLLVDNIANQDTEKVFQTVSVASVERTALAAATEDHVWAKASSVRMAAKKRACRTESETCQGNLFLKSWGHIILLSVCVNVSEILLLSFNRNCIRVETELPKILRYVLMNTLSPNNSEDECQQVNLFYTIPKIKYCL